MEAAHGHWRHPLASLGLLLGRDYLEWVGVTMSFSRRLIKFDFLNTSAIPLKQLAAGHFPLRLIPRQWPSVGTQKWCRVCTDGIIELQVTLREWLTRRLKASDPLREALVHEHICCRSVACKLVCLCVRSF